MIEQRNTHTTFQQRPASCQHIESTSDLHPDDKNNEVLYDDWTYETRPPSSASRYRSSYVTTANPRTVMHVTHHQRPPNQPIYQRASRIDAPITQPPVYENELPLAKRTVAQLRFHWLVLVGLSLCVMLVGWILFSIFSDWWQGTQDDLHFLLRQNILPVS